MRNIMKLYVVLMFLFFIAIIVLALFKLTSIVVLVCVVGILINMIYSVPIDDVKWHLTREQMLADSKESVRMLRNCNALIEKTKKELFKKHILTKEEVGKILDKE